MALLTLTDLTVLTAFLFSSILRTLVIVVRGSPVLEVMVFVQIPANQSVQDSVSESRGASQATTGERTVVPGVLDLLEYHLLLSIH